MSLIHHMPDYLSLSYLQQLLTQYLHLVHHASLSSGEAGGIILVVV